MGSGTSTASNRAIHLQPASSAPIGQGKSSTKIADTVSSTCELKSSDTIISKSEISSSHGKKAPTADDTKNSIDRPITSHGDNALKVDEGDTGETINRHMIETELNELTTKKYMMLRTRASDATAIKQKLNDDGLYVDDLKNTIGLFYDAYFMPEEASIDHIIRSRNEIAKILIETKLIDVICDCFLKIHIRGWVSADGIIDKSGYAMMLLIVRIMHNYSDLSDEFVESLVNYETYMETIKTMLEERADKHLKNDRSPLSIADFEILKGLMGVAHNVSMRTNNVTRLRSLNFTDVLKPYLDSWNEGISRSTLATLAAIVNEAECKIINAAPERVQNLLDVLEKGLDTNIRRFKGWSCKECAYTVRLLAQNDANKTLLVKLGALKLLVILGKKGNEDEQYESVQAVWVLCFDKNNQEMVAKDENLGVVELLFDLKKSPSARIRQTCNGALWTLRDALASSKLQKYRIFAENVVVAEKLDAGISTKAEEKKETDTEETDDHRGHIMISYQWDNQQLLKVIRDKLQENNYKVWMDIDEMRGSTLEAMASAVENAELVLLCMSQKYKTSPNCRAEAEYAFKKNKEILPLKMERGYDPDGWLGIICGTKMFYEFSGKYKFEDKLKELLRALARNWNKKGPQLELSIQPKFSQKVYTQPTVAFDHVDSASAPSASSRIIVSMKTIDAVRKWTDSEFKTWIDKNGLKSVLPSNINTDDIALLLQMRMESPDFFYRCTHDMLKNLSSLSKLVWALQTITQNGHI
ncbi:uncharacterized protein LOC127871976 isoform X2 [Dreissena polymorpha]|uniref:uncharacterized protein LOC127871976 isoform X2 n=1 Tax=Dreissena polymorpha TaxID=45954 RepID=UPI00226418A7|nr:uncharacterized protein LOC127871976 isoform X2 [Dreissena polymorpha]